MKLLYWLYLEHLPDQECLFSLCFGSQSHNESKISNEPRERRTREVLFWEKCVCTPEEWQNIFNFKCQVTENLLKWILRVIDEEV